ncbi:MAG: hypothetical protein OK436_06875, partial [Thaumarchaeota archaeon]|nr:hypothetical protein [Nitrososphaerota archaeon]
PAGRGDGAFRALLAKIDWARLYAEGDGFFMIEDLKAQWRQAFEPDYVLIDSRTGYSEIHGICTRQLPDAVVVVFFPNEQNLVGLREVVADIRSEVRRTREKPIRLIFVMSNVPDLDDEEQILQGRIRQFQDELRFREADVIIHRYDSLALLNQAIFTRERPNSRLAREYHSLKEKVVGYNPDDRDTIVNNLRRIVSFRRGLRETGRDVESRLDQILEQYSQDPEILLLVSTLRGREGRLPEAVSLLDRRIEVGGANARVLLFRADLQLQLNQQGTVLQGAVLEDLLKVLRLTKVNDFDLARLVRFAHNSLGEKEESRLLQELPDSLAFATLDSSQKYPVIKALEEKRRSLLIAVNILRKMLADKGITLREQERFSRELARCLIGLGRFEEVVQMLGQHPDPKALDPVMAFHYGMALWGRDARPSPRFFQRALELDQERQAGVVNPSFYQRQAIAAWAVGDKTVASHAIE